MITKQDKKNAVWNSASFIYASVAGFLNFTLTLKSYSTELFGFYILISSIFGLGFNIDFGFGAATIRQLSIAKKENDTDFIKRFLFTYLIAYIILSVTITSLMLLYFFVFIFNTSLIQGFETLNLTMILIFISVSYMLKYLNNFLKNIFEGFSEFVILSKITIFITSVNTALILMIYLFKLDIIYLAMFTFLFQLVSFAVYTISLVTYSKEFSLSFTYFDFTLIKKYSLYGINIQVAAFINGIIDPAIKYLLGNMLSLSYVTYFETSKKIIDLSNGLIFSAQKGIFNKLSEQLSSGKLNEFVNQNLFYYSKMSNYYSILVYGILNPAICAGMLLWFKSYESMMMLIIFFMPYSLINYGGPLYSVLMVDGKGVRLVIIQSLNLILSSSFIYFSLLLFGNYIGLLAFFLSIFINNAVIFSFLKRTNEFNSSLYIGNSRFYDIIKLNVLLLSQVFLMLLFKEYMIFILAGFFILYNLIFIDYTKYFYKIISDKIIYLKRNRY